MNEIRFVLSAVLLASCASTTPAPRTAAAVPARCPEPGPASAPAPASPVTAPPPPAGPPLDPAPIAQASGVTPQVAPDGVVRISWARADVPVTVDGVPLRPPAGLSSWAAFTAAPGGAMAMGDTVVFEDEVDAAMDAAFAHGLEVTGLHNHFFFARPAVFFMHVGGMGDPAGLAADVKAVWDAIRQVRAGRRAPADHFAGPAVRAGTLDAAALGQALGHEGTAQDGVLKVTIARPGTMHGVGVGGSMGLTTWAAFSGSDAAAAVDGDFIMTAAEVQPTLRALRAGGLHVVALHNHMIGEEPAFFFTHFWGRGGALDLAHAVRGALDAQSSTPLH
jgi:uncharacterized protein DUF1259